MDMFDHIKGTCPSCNGELYGQIKAGDQCFNTYWVEPEMNLYDAYIVDSSILNCMRCNRMWQVESEEIAKVKVKLKEYK